MGRHLVIDIETDDLNASVVWCCVLTDLKTQSYKVFTNNGELGYIDIKELPKHIEDDDILIGHNLCKFDLPTLARLVKGFKYKNPTHVRDTLVMSQLFNQERENGHSLKAWGIKLGLYKGEYNDWSKLTQEMVDYCIQDTMVTCKLYHTVRLEGRGFPIDVLYLEQRIAEICNEVETHGHVLDYEKATELLAVITETRDGIAYSLQKGKPKIPYLKRLVAYKRKNPTKKDPIGELYASTVKPLEGYCKPEDITGDYSLLVWEEFSVSSRQQCVYQLLLQGWQPTKFSEKTGAPTLDGDVLDELIEFFPDCKDIGEYFLIDKRHGAVKSWLNFYRQETGRVHGGINPIGCRTHRASHANPNKGQIPGVSHDKHTGKILYGRAGSFNAECRACWTVPKGFIHLGVDASAIQLVILAHALGSHEYAEAVAKGDKKKGTDVHTINRNVLREAAKEILKCDEEGVLHIDRDKAKTFDI